MGKILKFNVVSSLDTICTISTTIVMLNLMTSFTTMSIYHGHGSF